MFKDLKKNNDQSSQVKIGQAIIEFVFAFAIVLLMAFAIMKIFVYSGLDLAERARRHDEIMLQNVDQNWDSKEGGPWNQMSGFLIKERRINAVLGDNQK